MKIEGEKRHKLTLTDKFAALDDFVLQCIEGLTVTIDPLHGSSVTVKLHIDSVNASPSIQRAIDEQLAGGRR